MPAHALVEITCPSCSGRFVERANLLRRGGQAWCPFCEKLFDLDENTDSHRDTLAAARDARQRRKQRLSDLRNSWRDVPAAPVKPLTMLDILRRLDGLLDRIDALSADAKPGH